MCSECFEILNCQCKFCDFEDVIKDEELAAKYQGCPDCGHTPISFYNLKPWNQDKKSDSEFVEIILEVIQ